MHGARQPRRPATPRQTHRPTLPSVHEGRKSTRTKEDVSYGIRKKILGKNREFQTAGRRWVSDRCRHYGYPRLTVELRDQSEHVGKTRVARLMREAGLQGRQRRASRPRTTQSDHAGPIAPNRLAELPALTDCDQA
jgi:hypothetical protein